MEEELLRAVPLRDILCRFGRVLVAPAGTEKSFCMSRSTTKISLFLSHSWSTSGRAKTLGLMFFANFQRAFLISSIVALFMFVWIATNDEDDLLLMRGPGSLFLAGRESVRELPTNVAGLVPTVLFLFILVFGQHLPGKQTMCFLDKCCIHQTDVTKKREGIKLLAKFLQISDNLIILWQPDYMTRLWCVYELAAFLHLKQGTANPIYFLPLKVPIAQVGMFLLHTFTAVAVQLIGPIFLSEHHAEWVADVTPHGLITLHYFVTLLLEFFFGFVFFVPAAFRWFESHIQDHQSLMRQLRDFKMAQTSCFLEEDRRFVEGQIIDWFGSIESFEREVRTSVGDIVERQVRSQVPMKWAPVASTALPHLYILMMHVAFYLRRGDWHYAFVEGLFATNFVGCGNAIPVALIFRWWNRKKATRCGKIRFGLLIHFVFVFCAASAFIVFLPSASPYTVGIVLLIQVALTLVLFASPSRHSAWTFAETSTEVPSGFPGSCIDIEEAYNEAFVDSETSCN